MPGALRITHKQWCLARIFVRDPLSTSGEAKLGSRVGRLHTEARRTPNSLQPFPVPDRITSRLRKLPVHVRRPTSITTQPVDQVTNGLISDIAKFLEYAEEKSIETNKIEGFVHKQLDQFLPRTFEPHQVYEAVIHFLISKTHAQVAATVFERMHKKGFISSNGVDAQMLAVALAFPYSSPEPLVARLAAIVADPGYAECNMVALLRTLENFDLDKDIVAFVTESFVANRGPDYAPDHDLSTALITAFIRAGNVEKAFATLDKRRGRISPGRRSLYVVEALRSTDNWYAEAAIKLGNHLSELVADPAYTENDLLELFENMSDRSEDQNVVATVAERFVASRGVDYCPSSKLLKHLVVTSARAGNIEGAFEMLERDAKRPRDPDALRVSYEAQVAFMAILRDTCAADSGSVARLLSMMHAQGMPVNIDLFNVLLAREVRLGKTALALAMYTKLKKMAETQDIAPDSFTFGSLFALYRTVRPRSLRAHLVSRTPDSLSPRRLYAEFTQSVKRKYKPVEVTTTLLNAALRMFLRQRDYAGAYVVIMSYPTYKVPLDHRTYYSVVKLIIRRIWVETAAKRKQGALRWSDHFLGVNDPSVIELNEDLVQHMFFLLSRDKFDVRAPLYAPDRASRPVDRPKFKFPSMAMMESVDRPQPRDFHYEVAPLARILRRAILADLSSVHENPGLAEVYKAVADAEGEMLS